MSFIFSCAKAQNGYEITGNIQGLDTDTLVYLVEYRGNNQYMTDTSDVTEAGKFTFSDEEKLPAGMYIIYLPDITRMDIIIDQDQHFSFSAESEDINGTITFEGSEDNNLYYEYIRRLSEKRAEASELNEEMQEATEERQEEIRARLQNMNTEVREFQEDFAEKHNHSFVSDFILMTLEPQIPDHIDRNTREALYYYRDHFFENIDLQDPRVYRTPIIHDKIEQYLENLTPKHPDSVKKAADFLAESARGNDELFRHIVHHITREYERSDIMGMDAVFVHMVNNYFKTGDATWVSKEQLEAIIERAETLEPLLIGKTAPDLTMEKMGGGTQTLSQIDAEFTILYFWDYDCGHCRRVTPDLYETYMNYRDRGVEVMAICTRTDKDKWKEYINDNEFHEWTNVIDPFHRSNFRDKYDIYSTPVVFIVDSEREIVAKRLGVQQIPGVLDNLLSDDSIH